MSDSRFRDQRHSPQASQLKNPLVSAPRKRFVRVHEDSITKMLHPAPLSAPCYWQESGFWCNLASLTNCVQFHIGKWPGGGLGSTWGETGL